MATLGQLGVQAVGVAATFAVVFTLSMAAFYVIKLAIGLRVSEDEEQAGLDISTHGMYGYPEQFIPQEEYGSGAAAPARTPAPAGAPSTATAMVANRPEA